MAEPNPDILLTEGRASGGGEVRYHIDIGGKGFEVFFRSADVPLYSGVEPALPLALLGAMRTRSDIRVLSPVSHTYAENMRRVIGIYTGWFSQFSRVSVHPENPVQEPSACTGRMGLFFSGGVDSFYTLSRNIDDITDLIYIHGFDVRLDDHARRQAISEMGQAVAEATGKRFIQIESNLGKVIQEYGDWRFHGGGLAILSVGRILQHCLDRIYISSDMAFQDLRPWSIHPATVPLFNNKALSFVLYGSDATRLEKIESITNSEPAMRYLRVCEGRVEGRYNCGECEKCLRTMTSLHALGALERCTAFGCGIDVKKVRKTTLIGISRLTFLDQNLRLMEERGLSHTPLYDAWQAVRQRPLWCGKLLRKHRKRWKRFKKGLSRLSGHNEGDKR